MPTWATILVSVIGSSALFGFAQFLISRNDAKSNRKSEILAAITALDEKMDEQKKDTDNRFTALEKQMAEERATQARIRILAYSDEIMHGVRHSEESFNQALSDITLYENYCASNPQYKNARATVAIGNIQSTYEKCVREGSFLGMR